MSVKRISDIMVTYRIYILGLLCLLAGASLLFIPGLKVGVFFDDFYPEKDPELNFYKHLTSELGGDENVIVLAIRADSGIYDRQTLHAVRSFSNDAAQSGLITHVSDPTRLKYYTNTPFGILPSYYLDADLQSKEVSGVARFLADSFFTRRFQNIEQNLVLVYLTLADHLDPNEVDQVLGEIRQKLSTYGLSDYRMIGKKYLETEYRKIVNRELLTSILLTLAVIVILLALFFRSFTGIFLPVISMILALVLLYGIIAAMGRDLGFMSNLFPTIILIVGMSDIIHILAGYEEEAKAGKSIRQSTGPVIQKIGKAIFLTSLTTAIGFLTLHTSSMQAIRDFGTEGAIAVLIAFVFSILWTPLIIHSFNIKLPFKGLVPGAGWKNWARSINQFVEKKKKTILFAGAILVGISLIGIQKLNFNNRQLTNIPYHNQLRADFRFFNDSMGGSRSFELIVESEQPAGLRNIEELEKMSALHQYMEARCDVREVVSPVTWYHLISRVFDKSIRFPELPSQPELDNYMEKIPGEAYPKNWKIINQAETMGRFSGRIKDLGRLRIRETNKKIMQQIDSLDFSGTLHFRISGSDHMIDRGHRHRLENMLSGILIALIIVALLIGLIFRDPSLTYISLIVNLFPLLLVAGVMGFTGIEMRGSTSILFTIGFVIAVDDTIHFLARYQREKGRGHLYAIKRTIEGSGKPIATTSVILIAGFLTLLHSQSWDIRTLGYLVSLMLFAALITDLLLLPAILLKTVKE